MLENHITCCVMMMSMMMSMMMFSPLQSWMNQSTSCDLRHTDSLTPFTPAEYQSIRVYMYMCIYRHGVVMYQDFYDPKL